MAKVDPIQKYHDVQVICDGYIVCSFRADIEKHPWELTLMASRFLSDAGISKAEHTEIRISVISVQQ